MTSSSPEDKPSHLPGTSLLILRGQTSSSPEDKPSHPPRTSLQTSRSSRVAMCNSLVENR
ncbi:hypothetical protein F511_12808 [Dorcoceras hygrometricum]|uniref:Uncharacterized protein n=1 Tax=Dorcoceras hygrometricum TaxID=472368 RepID=A0A2Z7DDV9_9LAMI|nr:hypothetical protein F511_12808 [Dorcoceras hygrometricum]